MGVSEERAKAGLEHAQDSALSPRHFAQGVRGLADGMEHADRRTNASFYFLLQFAEAAWFGTELQYFGVLGTGNLGQRTGS